MKKITLLILLLLLSITSQSQVLIEGFEGTTEPNLTTDQWILGSGTWGVFDNGVGVDQSWKTTTSSTLVYEGTRTAFKEREYGPAGTTARDYLATPLVTIPANGQLRFFTRLGINGDTGALFKIMVAPATAVQNDPAAYTQVTSWTETSLVTAFNIYQEKSADLSAYAGQQIYIAFLLEYTSTVDGISGDRWYVDRVRVIEKCQNPTTLAVGGITQTSANLSWANPSGATQWEIEVIPFTATPTGVGVVVGSNPYTVTATTTPAGPLAPSTQYKYFVRAICGNTNPNTTVPSEWAGPFPFTTSTAGISCAAAIVIPSGVPYSTTDNTANYTDSTDTIQPTGCITGSTNYMTGNDVFYSYTATVTGAISIEMAPTGNNSSVFVYQGCSNVGVACLAGVANNNSTIRSIPSLNVTAGQTYIIVISSNSSTQTFGYTLTIQRVNCPAPTTLTATPATTTSANLSWVNPTSTSWEVFVQTAGSSIPTTAGQTANTNTNFNVTNLTGGAALAPTIGYQYWVRADCGDGTFSAWSGPTLFNTLLCNTGCTYNFVMTDANSNTWAGNTMTIKQGAVTVATLTGPATGLATATVPVTMCDGPFTLTWNAGGTGAGQVGISIVNSFGQTIYTKLPGTGAQNTTLFTSTINCVAPLCLTPTNLTVTTPTTTGATLNWTPNGTPASWQIYAVPTGSPAPTTATTPTITIPGTTVLPYVLTGLLADTAYTYYVSAICTGAATPTSQWSVASPSFTTIATCPKPTAVALTVATENSFTLNWTNGAAETSWEYLVLPATDPAPTAATTGWLPAPAHPLQVTGLLSATTYKAYVRAVCSSTDKSTIAVSPNATTLICNPANRCLYTFTVRDGDGDGWNGGTMIVVQNGITVATLTGPTNAQDLNPINVQVPICTGIPFNLIWNNAGSFYYEMGVTVTTPFGEVIFVKPTYTTAASSPPYPGAATPIFTNMGNCTPPTCPMPTALTATNATESSVLLGWTEAGTATTWELVVVDLGAPAPGPTPAGIITTGVNPVLVTGLQPGHNYSFYVRASCSATDKSLWAGAVSFKTLPANDNCGGAIFVPVNSNSTCNQSVSGSLFGATASGTPAIAPCIGNPSDDVWFQFIASNSYLNIALSNVVGTSTNLNHAVYSGGCGALTLVYCSTAGNLTSVANNLVVGQTYYIRVYSNSAAVHNTTFNLCITTPSTCANSPTVCDTTYTNTVGVTTLGAIGCLSETPNPSFFTIQILTTGPVRYTLTQSSPGSTTPDLDVDYAAWGPFTSQNAACSVISAGGAPLSGLTTGCSFSIYATETFNIPNAQAGQFYVILITNYSDDPGTISLTQSNASAPGAGQTFCCSDPNFSYSPTAYCKVSGTNPIPTLAFNAVAGIFTSTTGLVFANSATGEINLAASAAGTYVVTNTIPAGSNCPERHFDFTIKIEEPATATLSYTAAAFCKSISTPQPITLTGTAGGTYSVSPAGGLFINPTTGAITPSLSSQGVYTVYYNLGTFGTCASLQPSTQVEILASPTVTSPGNQNVCGSYVLPALSNGNYYTGQGGTGTQLAVGSPITSTQTIYVYAVQATCTAETSFIVTVTQPIVIPPVSNVLSCASYSLPALTVGNYYTGPGGTGTMLAAGTPLTTDQIIYIYAVDGPCTSEISFTLTIGSISVTAPADQTVCGSYLLPTLTNGNYFTGSGGTGTPLAVGSTINTTQTIYVYESQSVSCTAEDSFLVTVNQIPVIAPISNVVACESFNLPTLAVGNYFTATGGGGTQLNVGDPITTDQTIFVYAQTGTTPNCTAEQLFTVTIVTVPVVAPIADVSQCTPYTLPALANGNYFTGSGGTGTQLPVGAPIASTQTIYVYDQTGTTPNCTDEESFTVTIGTIPSFSFFGECQGSEFVIEALPVNGSFNPDTATYSWTTTAEGSITSSANAQSIKVVGEAPYTVTVTSGNCSFTDFYTPSSTRCSTQKGISPNGDEKNDFFDLTGQDVRKLQIFNRYGTAVYEKNNYVKEWFGQTAKGDELPDGTYYYVINRANGENTTGWIYINRERN